MSEFSIQVEGLYKRFEKRTVLRDISFNHKKGILGIAGSNGAGKSTLMKCMVGLNKPTKGHIICKMNGAEIDFTEFKKHVGYAAPYINLYDELTCFENLHFILEMRNSSSKNDRINSVLRQTGIYPFAPQLFRNLSTGQRQRLRIAAALVHHPDVLFLDEPGSNLDDQGHMMIQQIVTAFKTADKSVVIASNDERELALCDVVYSVEKKGYLND